MSTLLPANVPNSVITLGPCATCSSPFKLNVAVANTTVSNLSFDTAISHSAGLGQNRLLLSNNQKYSPVLSVVTSQQDTLREAVFHALDQARDEGAKKVAIDFDRIYDGIDNLQALSRSVAIRAVLSGVNLYLDKIFNAHLHDGITDIVLALGDDSYHVWESTFGNLVSFFDVFSLSKGTKLFAAEADPLRIDFTETETPEIPALAKRNVHIKLWSKYRIGRVEDVYVVSTKSFLEERVKWKMAFTLFKGGEGSKLYLSTWGDPERVSPHNVIAEGRRLLLGNLENLDSGRILEKGYIKPSPALYGAYTLFDLSTDPYQAGSEVSKYRTTENRRLTSQAKAMQIYFSLMGIETEIDGSNFTFLL